MVRAIVRTPKFVRYAPKGMTKIMEELITADDALVAGGKSGIFTPMYLMIGKRPETGGCGSRDVARYRMQSWQIANRNTTEPR